MSDTGKYWVYKLIQAVIFIEEMIHRKKLKLTVLHFFPYRIHFCCSEVNGLRNIITGVISSMVAAWKGYHEFAFFLPSLQTSVL